MEQAVRRSISSICNRLENLREMLDDKINAILINAEARFREPTVREEDRIEEMESVRDDIDAALDYLREHCDD